MKLLGRRGHTATPDAARAVCSTYGQPVILKKQVIRHVSEHRQLHFLGREAGGQLFGVIEADRLVVTEASGPYAGDERSRTHYRSEPRAAQRAINERSARNLLYLGEWHTHPEDEPSMSGADESAIQTLRERSRLNLREVLLLIVGRSPAPIGLALWSVADDGIAPWTFER
jgi:integrative and conjugative element protein (TIGR02256 family)